MFQAVFTDNMFDRCAVNLIYRLSFDNIVSRMIQSKKISNDQELIQSDPKSCPQNQKGNN